MRAPVVGVVGPGEGASDRDVRAAFEVGKLIAREGWTLLTGGRSAGVMEAASRGAKSAGGLTVGVLPAADDCAASEAVDVAILTGMGEARNNVVALTSAAVVACGVSAGTASEVALAVRAERPVILLIDEPAAETFFRALGGSLVAAARTADEAVALVRSRLPRSGSRL